MREVFAPEEVAVLTALRREPIHTAQEAVQAIAELGGWQRYRKAAPPGVKSLWLGWTTFRGMVLGYGLARQQLTHEL